MMDNIKARDQEPYLSATRFAWDQGLHIGVIDVIGEL